MLVINRQVHESLRRARESSIVWIGDVKVVVLADHERQGVRLGIDAPPEVIIERGELRGLLAHRPLSAASAIKLIDRILEFFDDEPEPGTDAAHVVNGLVRAAEWFAAVHNAPIHAEEAARE